MDKLNVFKVLRCCQCGEEIQYIVRSWNVNECLTDSDIEHIAHNAIGHLHYDDCRQCGSLTRHECTAFNRHPL